MKGVHLSSIHYTFQLSNKIMNTRRCVIPVFNLITTVCKLYTINGILVNKIILRRLIYNFLPNATHFM